MDVFMGCGLGGEGGLGRLRVSNAPTEDNHACATVINVEQSSLCHMHVGQGGLRLIAALCTLLSRGCVSHKHE